MKILKNKKLFIIICWFMAIILYLLSISKDSFKNITFDEGIYLFESLKLAEGIPTKYFKGPFTYLIPAGVFNIYPNIWGALIASLFFSIVLLIIFYFIVRKNDKDIAFYGTFLIAICPLSIFFSFHIFSDAPLTIFLFLCVYFYCEENSSKNKILSSLFFCSALLVKSTAIVLFIILIICEIIFKRKIRDYFLVCAVPLLVYLLLPKVWPQVSDIHFFKALPYNSFRCGIFYYFIVLFMSVGPTFLFLSIVPFFEIKLLKDNIYRGAAISVLVLYAFFTFYGIPSERFSIVFIPFMALLAAIALKYWMPKRFIIAVLFITFIWITPLVMLTEADDGMTQIARYLKQFSHSVVYTTIPPGIHQDAFAGNLWFTAGKELKFIHLQEIKGLISSEGGIVIWTDWVGNIDGLEEYFRANNLTYQRLNFYTRGGYRPVFLINLAQFQEPKKMNWETNILTQNFVTGLDLMIIKLKHIANYFLKLIKII